MLFLTLPTWSLRVHCSVQMSVMRFLACLAISSRNMLHSDRLRSPMWWRCGGENLIISGLFLSFLNTATTMALPLQDRARVYRTWSVCRAEGSRRSADFGKEVPNTAETSFQMHGCRNWRMSSMKRGSWTIEQHCFIFCIENACTCFFLHLLPENRKVWGLHQHVHQRIDHLCVENNSVHHFAQFLVISQTKTGFWNTCVGLQKREGMQKSNEQSVSIRLNQVRRMRNKSERTTSLIGAVRSFYSSLGNKDARQSDDSDLCTYLKPEPVQPHASEVKHVSIFHWSRTNNYHSTIWEHLKMVPHPRTQVFNVQHIIPASTPSSFQWKFTLFDTERGHRVDKWRHNYGLIFWTHRQVLLKEDRKKILIIKFRWERCHRNPHCEFHFKSRCNFQTLNDRFSNNLKSFKNFCLFFCEFAYNK